MQLEEFHFVQNNRQNLSLAVLLVNTVNSKDSYNVIM